MAAAAASSSSGTRRYMGAGVYFSGEHLGKAFLRNMSGWTVEISLYGAQVISWKNAQGEELLFLSRKAIFEEEEMIRGGIPICFPKLCILDFASLIHSHCKKIEFLICTNRSYFQSLDHEMVRDLRAFASKSLWTADVGSTPFHARVDNDEAFIDLTLKPSPLITFPHNFELRLNVRLSPAGKLIMTTHIRNLNTNGKPFSFTFTYHNYLSVSDIRDVRIEDLETVPYLDYLQKKQLCPEQDTSITFESEVDRLYLAAPNRVIVVDHKKRRSIVICKNYDLPEVVVWNPWDNKKAKTITNFAKDEYNNMLCVGPACVETPIVLKPGAEWTGRQELMAKNFCNPH